MTAYNIAQDCLDRRASDPRLAAKTALIFIDESGRVTRKTFAQLALETGRVARWLRDRGARKGRRIVIQLPNGPEFVWAFLGAVKTGAIPIPISNLLTRSETRLIAKDSGASCLLRDTKAIARAARRGEPLASMAKTDAADPAFWLYTSGTEGRPKGVIHAHRSIPAHDARSRVWMGLRADDVVFNTSALNWSYALTAGFLDVWRRGATAVIARGDLKPERILKLLAEQKVTVFMSVPGIYRRLVEYGEARPKPFERAFRGVRVALSAGEKLPADVRRKFLKRGRLVIREGLGMTEHSVYLVQPCQGRVVEGSCGRPLPGHRIAILKKNLKPAAPREIGVVASHRSCPGLMLGYYRRPEDERRVFRAGWFLSGDLAYRDGRGNFHYVGRKDDVITAGGYRISPLEVEAVLNHHPRISESAVTGEEIAPGKTIVAAHVVLRKSVSGSESVAEDIKKFAGHRLARYKSPKKISFVDHLPKTSTGKIQRRAFRK